MLRVLICCCFGALMLCACSDQQLHAQDAWVRAAPDGKALGAAYFKLTNNGPESELLAVQSDAHESARVHMTEISEGIARMRAKDNLRMASDATLVFEPGGLHIMLMRPKRALTVGDSIQLSLEFSDGRTISFGATVRRGPP